MNPLSSPEQGQEVAEYELLVELGIPGREDIDLSLSFGAELRVDALEAGLLDYLGVGQDLRLALTGAHSTWNKRARLVLLPPDARVIDCGLTTGVRLDLTSPSAARGGVLYVPPSDNVDDPDPLYLTDVIGPDRGRVTRLMIGSSLLVGSDPGRAAATLRLDDRLAPELAFEIARRDDAREATLVVRNAEGLRVNGFLVSGTVRILPGSTIEMPVWSSERVEGTPPLRVITFSLTSAEGLEARNPFGRVRFESSTRSPLARYPRLVKDSIPNPPAEVDPPRLRPEQLLVSPIVGIVAVFVSGSWGFLLLAAVQPVVTVIGYFRDRNERKQRYETAKRVWEKETDDILNDFAAFVKREEDNRKATFEVVEEWATRALRRLPRLWERRPGDPDFMTVRLGHGDHVSGYERELKYAGAGTAQEREKIIGTVHRRSLLEGVPVTVDLAAHNVALTGPRDLMHELAASVVLQAATQNSPAHLVIAGILPNEEALAKPFDWLKWLPHFQSASTVLPLPHVAHGRREATAFLGQIIELLAERRRFRSKDDSARVVLVVHEAAEVDHSQLSEIIRLSDGLVHVLWLGSGRSGRPSGIDVSVSIRGDTADFESHDPESEWHDLDFVWEGIPMARAAFVARRMASLYDPLALGTSGGIPDIVPLSSVIALEGAERRSVAKQLAVPIGAGEHGVFEFDFVAHGPHVLIGGTTGSGKSELLQSMVAAAVTRYGPDQLNLVLVDYKGGATFATFENLPHVVGYVSDLTPGDVTRVLDFLREEMARRARLFDATRNGDRPPAKDYEEYIDRQGEGSLARLVVVFDEFASLITEHGDLKLMERVEDVAQRGRSWGVHLVLATQQPSGQIVSARVRANVGTKIALRTMDASNSETIIDAPDAALIPKSLRGRALARLGEGQIVAFQSAFAGSTREDERRFSTSETLKVRSFDLRRGRA